MKLNLTLPQMREKWLTIRRLNSAPLSASVTRTDGVDIEELVDQEINRWYHRLLLNADIRLLVTHEISTSTIVKVNDNFSAEVVLPPETVRLVNVMTDKWLTVGRIIDNPSPAQMLRQQSELTVSTHACPAVYRFANRLLLYPFERHDRLTSLQVVTHVDGVYEFDSLALSSLLPYDTDFSF